MKRLMFVTVFEYPSRQAHAVHGFQMARGFSAHLAGDFIFFVSVFADTESRQGIQIKKIFGPFGKLVRRLRLRRVVAPLSIFLFLLTHKMWRGKESCIFANDPVLFNSLGRIARMFGVTFIAEVHGIESSSRCKAIETYADHLICVTNGLKTEYQTLIKKPDIIVLPNAVDVDAFSQITEDTETLRTRLNLPKNHILIGYIGRFEPLGYDKGLEFLFQTIEKLPATVLCVLIGGIAKEIEKTQKGIVARGLEDRVVVIPHVPFTNVPAYAKALDILAYTPSSPSTFFAKETSPMKLFEYMAARKPIIISDMPAFREILNEKTAWIIPPGDSNAFIQSVESIIQNPKLAQERAEAAFLEVSRNTWRGRARNILSLG